MRDLIFVSLEDWDEVWRRNQFLCAGLARRFPDRKILFVGLPRDVSRVGGVPEIVTDGETGLLVPGDDAPALAEALTRLATDDALRRRLGAAGRKRAEQFNWATIAEQYLAIYHSIAKGRNT